MKTTVTFILYFLLFFPLISEEQDISVLSISGGGHYCKGEQIVLLCKASGNNLSYQWYKDESTIVGENSPTYLINSAGYYNSGIYKCLVSNSERTVESNQFQILKLVSLSHVLVNLIILFAVVQL